MFNLINKLFHRTKPYITKTAEVDGIKYGYLTDLKLIDEQLQTDLIAYAAYCLTEATPEPGVASSIHEMYSEHADESKTSEAIETIRRFSSFNTHKPGDLNNFFKRYYIPSPLADRIKQNLPKKIRKTNFNLVMIITNFGTPLHRDVCDKAIILCPVVTDNEITSFWEIKDEYKNNHSYSLHAFADPDKVERKLDLVFKPRESWILDVDKIHAVEPTKTNPTNRIIISLRWFDNTTVDDIVKWFQVK